ncbi:MAG: hypothetical protein A2252_00250 [Elusimicrobia bacterium RIFOXYA2_FULL_39_19]|nr:MAG: hypothetical protein A2252_00250 [Elusimicrobia bacterium RIFOXYA2_FULL_39_19]
MIKLENLTKYYGENLAVANISFEIAPGQIIGFLGPNGAGKSTTMRMLTGYLMPTSGKASVLDYDIVENTLEVKQLIGYLPETNPVYEEMTIPEYLRFVAEIRNYNPAQIDTRIKEVVELCALKDMLHKNIGELSRGYKQRVGFASAIFHDPKVLILDEPTSGLDPNQAREVRELIKELKKEKTVILSTHILSEVTAICDRIIIINKGIIAADGTPAELLAGSQGKENVYLEFMAANTSSADLEMALKSIDGIQEITLKNTNENVYSFEIVSAIDLRAEIFKTAVKNNWVLLEIRRQHATLEELFKQLTEK